MILTGVSVMQLFTKPPLAANATFWLDFTQSRALGESLFSLNGYTFSARREPVFGILQLRVKSATALSVWQMCSYCSSPTQTVASKKRAVISRMFPAFIITAPYGSPKTESVLNLLGNCLLPLPDEASASPASQAKQNMVFAATGRVRKVKRETSKFSHSLGVLARSDIPQSQHRQLNLIHKFDHPAPWKGTSTAQERHSSFMSLCCWY